MGLRTGIKWTDATWNPVHGCSRISEGCRNCYAEKVAARFSDEGQPFHLFADRNKAGSKWTGKVGIVDNHLCDPLNWRKPRRIFVNSMSDLFHESLSFEEIDRVFATMALCPEHTFQVLTKRAEKMRNYLCLLESRAVPVSLAIARTGWWDSNAASPCAVGAIEDRISEGCLPNVHVGVSVENQATADVRIPLLLQTPAAIRFISYEPALGPMNLEELPSISGHGRFLNALDDTCISGSDILGRLDWVICGGESGSGARPMAPEWARHVRDQCQAAGVPFFFKQWGEWLPSKQEGSRDLTPQALNCWDGPIKVGKKAAGALLDGREWKEFPDGRL